MAERPTLLFYCQHALGLGHLVRSLTLAGSLSERFNVVLLNGGRFPEGTTVEAAEAAFETLLSLEDGQAPPEGTPASEEVGFSGVATPGNDIQFNVPGGFESGRTYIFYCFISDRAGGPPHAIGNQMYKAFTIE